MVGYDYGNIEVVYFNNNVTECMKSKKELLTISEEKNFGKILMMLLKKHTMK